MRLTKFKEITKIGGFREQKPLQLKNKFDLRHYHALAPLYLHPS